MDMIGWEMYSPIRSSVHLYSTTVVQQGVLIYSRWGTTAVICCTYPQAIETVVETFKIGFIRVRTTSSCALISWICFARLSKVSCTLPTYIFEERKRSNATDRTRKIPYSHRHVTVRLTRSFNLMKSKDLPSTFSRCYVKSYCSRQEFIVSVLSLEDVRIRLKKAFCLKHSRYKISRRRCSCYFVSIPVVLWEALANFCFIVVIPRKIWLFSVVLTSEPSDVEGQGRISIETRQIGNAGSDIVFFFVEIGLGIETSCWISMAMIGRRHRLREGIIGWDMVLLEIGSTDQGWNIWRLDRCVERTVEWWTLQWSNWRWKESNAIFSFESILFPVEQGWWADKGNMRVFDIHRLCLI